MALSKKQKLELKSKEFCKKYITHDWDGCAANEYFTKKCDLSPEDKYWGKPSHAPFDGLRDLHYAENDVYMNLCPAYVKEELIKRLNEMISSEVKIPDKINNKEKYLEAYLSKAKRILSEILQEKFYFQKPSLE
jgi:hypothetical protein